MTHRILIYVSLLAFAALACSKPVTRPASTIEPSTPANTGNPAPAEGLQKRVEEIASAAKGRVGVSAMVLDDFQSNSSAQGSRKTRNWTISLNPDEHFPMQSVYKLPIGMAVMEQVDTGKIRLDQKVQVTKGDFIGESSHSPIRDRHPNGVELTVSELMRWMLGESDGTASDVLMKLAGGHEAVQAYLTKLKVTDMVVLDTEKALAEDHSLQFRNWSTPEAALTLLRALYERRALSESATTYLLKTMTESKPGAKRLRGLLPAGTVVAHKTGTSGTENGVTAATNDIGIITLPSGKHVAIAVFVANSLADQATRESVIAKISKAIFDEVGK
jgi:beta-lactamase class A